jgi:HEPN domain-containing protein
MISLLSCKTTSELNEFCRLYSPATLLLQVAAQDYSAARCLLLNGHFPGLGLGAQAIEKLLKAYLLFHDPKMKTKGYMHSLGKLLDKTDELYKNLNLKKYKPLVEDFLKHYQSRYPDNANVSTSRSTAEITDLDEIVIFLNENLPIPLNARYHTGLYSQITFSLGYNSIVTQWEFWSTKENRTLIPLLPRIRRDYIEVMSELYPNNPEILEGALRLERGQSI